MDSRALAEGEVLPPEGVRPLVLAAHGDRLDIGRPELGYVGLELGHRRRRRHDPGLGKEVLAVPEADDVKIIRDPVLLSVDGPTARDGTSFLLYPAGARSGHVHELAGGHLGGFAAAAPLLEDIGDVVALKGQAGSWCPGALRSGSGRSGW